MSYVDGFVLAVPKANLEAYKDMTKLGGKIWMEYGALSYVECLADDVPYGELTSFPRAVQATDDEPWCSRGSSTRTRPRATRSWPRSWPTSA
jgi:uncharacterized protein YbaA (DUF1428 family)